MSGIRTNAAAEYLGVSPSTLRTWERRFGFPEPRRTSGGHRQFDLAELEALRRSLLETSNISSAIDIARRRGEGTASPGVLTTAFDRFDERAADQLMEESLAIRSLERALDELLLPALGIAAARPGHEAEAEFGRRWATGWIHGMRRLAPRASREEGVLVFDASSSLDVESVHVHALELALRRAGLRVLLLSIGLAQERVTRAIRALSPKLIVLAGSGTTLDVLGRLLFAARRIDPQVRIAEYRDAAPVTGRRPLPSLGEGSVSGAAAAALELLAAPGSTDRTGADAGSPPGVTLSA